MERAASLILILRRVLQTAWRQVPLGLSPFLSGGIEQKVQRVALGIDCPVEIEPLRFDFDIRLINFPGVSRGFKSTILAIPNAVIRADRAVIEVTAADTRLWSSFDN